MKNISQSKEFSLLIETEKQKQKLFLFLIILIEVFFIAIYYKSKSLSIVGGSIILLVSLFWLVFSVKNTLLLLFVYISFLPSFSWGSRYDFFRGLYFKEQIGIVFITMIFLWSIGEKILNKEPVKKKFTTLDWTIVIFLLLSFLAALRGAFGNEDLNIIKTETFFLFCYALYFIYTRNLSISQIEGCWTVLIFITILVSIEYILLAFSLGSLSNILVTRVVTQQPHLAQITVPIFGSYLIFPNTTKFKKFLSLVAILPIGAMIFLSQQRGLWVGILFSMTILWGFAFFKDQISFKKLIKFLFFLIFILSFIFASFVILDRMFTGSIFLTLLSRIGSLPGLSVDPSTNIRLSEIMRAINKWNNNILNVLFGTGLGASYESINADRTYTFSVDNSYVFILWKIGIVGLVTYFGVLFIFFKRGLYIFTHTVREWYKQISASLMSGFLGLLIIGLTNSCLVSYRFIIIWAFVIATIEILYRQVKQDEIRK